MKKIQLDIVAISHSVSATNNYAVILGETDGSRRLPVVIGGFEAQAIAVAVEKMTPNRPLTHDLFKNTMDSFGIIIEEILINDLLDGIFYAQMICIQDGNTFIIDSRTSDAIAMAVRFNCPIYTFESVLNSAGINMDEDNEKKSRKPSPPQQDKISSLNVQQLEKLLEEVLEKEDYEKAAKIRDEINKRSA